VTGSLLANLAFNACAALTPLDAEELSNATGAAGLTIGIDFSASGSEVNYSPDNTDFNLIFGDTNLNLQFDDLKVDIIELNSLNHGAIHLTLPTEITFEDFNSGTLFLSGDNIVGNSTAPPLPAPTTKEFQVVATGGNQQPITDLSANTFSLTMQDVGADAGGSLSGSGRLRIIDWDRPDGAEAMSASGFVGSGVATYTGGYGSDGVGGWGDLVTYFSGFTVPGANFGTFGSAVTSENVRDNRIRISLEKETELRFQFDNTGCRELFAGNSRCDHTASEEEVFDPAIVILDQAGNFINGDISSGGPNECSSIGFGGLCADDTINVTKALLNVTLGDPYLKTVPDRRLGGATISAPPEQNFPLVVQQNTLNPRGKINLGGSISVFGVN